MPQQLPLKSPISTFFTPIRTSLFTLRTRTLPMIWTSHWLSLPRSMIYLQTPFSVFQGSGSTRTGSEHERRSGNLFSRKPPPCALFTTLTHYPPLTHACLRSGDGTRYTSTFEIHVDITRSSPTTPHLFFTHSPKGSSRRGRALTKPPPSNSPLITPFTPTTPPSFGLQQTTISPALIAGPVIPCPTSYSTATPSGNPVASSSTPFTTTLYHPYSPPFQEVVGWSSSSMLPKPSFVRSLRDPQILLGPVLCKPLRLFVPLCFGFFCVLCLPFLPVQGTHLGFFGGNW
jgi:hypothetical protein